MKHGRIVFQKILGYRIVSQPDMDEILEKKILLDVLKEALENLLPEETLEAKQTEMYMEGYKASLVKDTSYKGLCKVSFTLREF